MLVPIIVLLAPGAGALKVCSITLKILYKVHLNIEYNVRVESPSICTRCILVWSLKSEYRVRVYCSVRESDLYPDSIL